MGDDLDNTQDSSALNMTQTPAQRFMAAPMDPVPSTWPSPGAQPQPSSQTSAEPSADPTANAQNHVSGKAMFFGNLLKTLMVGMKAGMESGNPRNAFDRGVAAGVQAPRMQAAQLNDDQMTKAKLELAKAQAQHAIQMAHDLPTERVFELQQIGYRAGLEADKTGAEDVIQPTSLPEAQAYALQQNGKRDGYSYGVYPSQINTDDPSKTQYVVKKVTEKGILHDIDVPSVTTNPETGEQEIKWQHVDSISQADFQAMTSKTLLGSAQNAMKGTVQSVVQIADEVLSDPKNVKNADQAQSYLSSLKAADPKYLQAHPAIFDKVRRAAAVLQDNINSDQGRKIQLAREQAAIHEGSKELDKADDPVYARDQEGVLRFTTRGEAKDQGMQITSPKLSEAGIKEDQQDQKRLNDITKKVTNYEMSMRDAQGFSAVQRKQLAVVLGSDEFKVAISGGGGGVSGISSGSGQGVGAGVGLHGTTQIPVDWIYKIAKAHNLNQLDPEVVRMLQSYYAAATIPIELQKLESKSSRMSTAAMALEGQQLPSPLTDFDQASGFFDNLHEQIGTWEQGLPKFPGIDTTRTTSRKITSTYMERRRQEREKALKKGYPQEPSEPGYFDDDK